MLLRVGFDKSSELLFNCFTFSTCKIISNPLFNISWPTICYQQKNWIVSSKGKGENGDRWKVGGGANMCDDKCLKMAQKQTAEKWFNHKVKSELTYARELFIKKTSALTFLRAWSDVKMI